MKWISYRVYMQDNLACKNKYLCHFLSFSMLPSLLKRIHTDIIVVPLYIIVKRQNWHLARIFITGDFSLIWTWKLMEITYLHEPFRRHYNKPVDDFLIFLLAVLSHRESLVSFSLLWSRNWHGDRCFYVNCGLRLDIGIFSY